MHGGGARRADITRSLTDGDFRNGVRLRYQTRCISSKRRETFARSVCSSRWPTQTHLTNATALAPAVAAAGTALALVGVMGARGKPASRDQVTPVQANTARFSRRRGAQVHDRRQLEVRKGHDVRFAGSLGAVKVRVQIARVTRCSPNAFRLRSEDKGKRMHDVESCAGCRTFGGDRALCLSMSLH